MKHRLISSAVSVIVILAIHSCGTTYREAVSTDTDNVIKISRLHLRSTASNCKRREVIILKDKVSGDVLSVEKRWSNCRGAYEYETQHKKWEQKDGKLVRIF